MRDMYRLKLKEKNKRGERNPFLRKRPRVFSLARLSAIMVREPSS